MHTHTFREYAKQKEIESIKEQEYRVVEKAYAKDTRAGKNS